MPPKRHAPPKRTVQLPAALRDELVSLGRIPALGKGKGGRKERRKAARTDGNAAKAAHFAQKKRKAEEEEQDEQDEPLASTSRDGPSDAKRKKAAPAAPAPPPKKMTALQRIVAKQEGTAATSTTRKKNKVESTEDQEIAWLEAKLGVRGGAPGEEKGKWKGEYTEDGLDDLFAGLDELEEAAFGSDNEKDYAELLGELQESEDDSEGYSDEEDDHEDSEDAEMGDYGASDEELFVPADDDDHDEMGEIGSVDSGSNDDDELLEGDSDDEREDEDEEESEEEPEVKGKGKKKVTFESPAAPLAGPPADAPTRYIPPHLRKAAVSPFDASAKVGAKLEAPAEDPRLRRQILGLLNKLSSSNMPAIMAALAGFYASNPRASVSTTLTSVLLDVIATRDNLGEAFIITYAALVAALSKSVGIELPAGVISKCVGMFDEARAKAAIPVMQGEVEVGFEGRPGSKECENLVAFLAELYNFQVIACVLVYDLVKEFIDSGLGELDVELLVKVVKRSGQQLRQDDPSSLKEIITLVKQKMQGVEPSSMNSRTRFMIDALTNLKNNKIKPDANGAVDNYTGLKKFISGLKKRSGSTPEALRISLADIRSSSTKGKWWIVGAAWGGDPLVDAAQQSLGLASSQGASDAVLMKLAKKQGMNTDIRKGIFVVLMSSEDYVDACERLLQLGLTDIQQREVARVLLQCSGNEKTYNPYYTLVAYQMGTKSHGFQITLQYCLWDFLRELGEKGVGGEEMVKKISEDGPVAKVSDRRVINLAKLYAWCVAKDVLSLAIFKPVPFGRPRPQTVIFLQQFFTSLIISTQSPSPALILTATGTRRDKEALERVFVKAAPFDSLLKGMLYFFETVMDETSEKGEKERGMIKWGMKVAKETMGVGGGMIDVR